MKCSIVFDSRRYLPWELGPGDPSPTERVLDLGEAERYLRAAGAKAETVRSALEAAQATGRAEVEIERRPLDWRPS